MASEWHPKTRTYFDPHLQVFHSQQELVMTHVAIGILVVSLDFAYARGFIRDECHLSIPDTAAASLDRSSRAAATSTGS